LISDVEIIKMPSVATQTEISTVSPGGFVDWCHKNMDIVDGLDLKYNYNILSKTITKGTHTSK